MDENGTTSISGILDVAGDERPPRRRKRVGLARMLRAVVRLVCAGRRLAHVPTLGQVRAMAHWDGREPCSYLLDRGRNFVPEPLEFGYERETRPPRAVLHLPGLARAAMELVTMRDGGGFDLLSGW
jgi:hypothetical protein